MDQAQKIPKSKVNFVMLDMEKDEIHFENPHQKQGYDKRSVFEKTKTFQLKKIFESPCAQIYAW